jgi:hypothetical protein
MSEDRIGGQRLPHEEVEGLPEAVRRGNRMRPHAGPLKMAANPEKGHWPALTPGGLICLWQRPVLNSAARHIAETPGNNLAPRPLWEWEHGDIEPMHLREAAVEQFIHLQNLEHYRRLLVAPDQKDEVRRQTILKLLADEMSKGSLPRRGQ